MAETRETVYQFSAGLLNGGSGGREVSLGEFRGQVLLIVNTASKCGFTQQYAGMEQLYQMYKDHGLAVLGFPCNQFGAQEPGSEAEIGAFCETNYGVTFPLFAKIEVNGPGAHPLYQYLKKAKPGIFGVFGGGRIQWNFTKFLVDRQGSVAGRYGPSTDPKSLSTAVEKLLASA